MPRDQNFRTFLLDILQTVVLALAIFVVVYFLLFQPHQVSGDSMYPNFDDREYLLTEKVSYRLDKPKRGDVVVFKAPPEPSKDYIKRVIALPGETVGIKEGKVYIDGQLLQEPYLSAESYTSAGLYLPEGVTVTVGPDEYFVVGDNRPNSSDSRRWGAVKRKKFVGRAWLVYWPPRKFGFIRYDF